MFTSSIIRGKPQISSIEIAPLTIQENIVTTSSSKHPKSTGLRSNEYLPKAGPKSKSGGRNQRRESSGSYAATANRRSREDSKRKVFISKINRMATEARFIADALLPEERNITCRQIVEEMITEFDVLSSQSASRQPAQFMDVHKAIVEKHDALNTGDREQHERYMRMVRFSTHRGVDALKGALHVVERGKTRSEVIEGIHAFNANRAASRSLQNA
jgi:hypothetical protein